MRGGEKKKREGCAVFSVVLGREEKRGGGKGATQIGPKKTKKT